MSIVPFKNRRICNSARQNEWKEFPMTPPDDLKQPDPGPENVPPTGVATGVKLPRQVRSETLLQGDRELQIIHGEEVYRLSVTRQGKLILHK
jgi:hemin uptake protein HemP